MRPVTAPDPIEPELERFIATQRTEAETLRAAQYETCDLKITLSARELHEVYPQQFATWIEEVVKVEGPIHADGVTRRIAEAAGVRRIGSRIEAAFAAGVREVLRGGRLEQRGKFLSLRGMLTWLRLRTPQRGESERV